jgi:hypothetical protein
MPELIITDKQQYFDDNYPFGDAPKLTDKKRCIHCDKIIVVGDYKVLKSKQGVEFICCPNAPDCNGTVIDWF